MSKYKSSKSVGYRKPIWLDSNDPRAKTDFDLEKYRSRIGAEILVKPKKLESIELSEYVATQYWISEFYDSLDYAESGQFYDMDTNNTKSLYAIGRDQKSTSNTPTKQINGILALYNTNKEIVEQKKFGIFGDSTISINPESIFKYSDTIFTAGHLGILSGSNNFPTSSLCFYVSSKNIASGIVNWSKKYSVASPYAISLNQIKVKRLSDGNLFVGGSYKQPNKTGGFDPVNRSFIMKTDSSGNIVWQKSIDDSHWIFSMNLNFVDMAIDSQDNVYIFGTADYIYSLGSDRNFVIKFDKNGNKVWAKVYSDGGRAHLGKSMSIDNSDNIYISFYQVLGTQEIHVVKINSSGSVLWAKHFSGYGDDAYIYIAHDKSNNAYFLYADKAGGIGGSLSSNGCHVFKFDSSGNLITKCNISMNTSYYATFNNIRTNSSDNVYLIGSVSNSVPFAFYLPTDLSIRGSYTIPSDTYSWTISDSSVIPVDSSFSIYTEPDYNIYTDSNISATPITIQMTNLTYSEKGVFL